MSRSAQIAPSPHRFTREEYHRMGEAGLFANERVELLDGTIVTMSPHTTGHAAFLDQLYRALSRALSDETRVRIQLPIVLDDWSEPEPDVAVCRPDVHAYLGGHPQPDQVLLVCEVAVSSLSYDRSAKAAAYARSGIAEYWIIDVESRIVQTLADPIPAEARYASERRLGAGDILTIPGGATIAVSDVLPPR